MAKNIEEKTKNFDFGDLKKILKARAFCNPVLNIIAYDKKGKKDSCKRIWEFICDECKNDDDNNERLRQLNDFTIPISYPIIYKLGLAKYMGYKLI
jgi:hypothetical protein